MKRRSLLYFGIGLAVCGANSFLPVAAQSRRGVTRRVQFARGSTSTTINGSVVLGNKDTYIFRARQGQTIIADVTWLGTRVDNVEDQGLSGFTFIAANGQSYEDQPDQRVNSRLHKRSLPSQAKKDAQKFYATVPSFCLGN